jgi:UDP-glucose 4-epimerase
MKRILITGGNGYIGARLCTYLSRRGFDIAAQCYPSVPNDNSWIRSIKEIIVGDLRDDLFYNQLMVKEYDVVINLVSLDHIKSQNDPHSVIPINVSPTWRMLNALQKTKLKKFIYFSTVQIYGTPPNIRINELQAPNPQNAYALTHYLSEIICNYFNRCSDINCINIRLSNSYGSPVLSDANCWWLAINDFCRTAFYDKKIIIFSDGSPLRDFIHYEDVCKAVETLIIKSDKVINDSTYNISFGQTYSVLEIAQIIASIYKDKFDSEIPIFINKTQNIDTSIQVPTTPRFIIDNSKLFDLGFSPQVTLDEGIRELFDYFLTC